MPEEAGVGRPVWAGRGAQNRKIMILMKFHDLHDLLEFNEMPVFRKKDVFLRELFSFYGQKWLQGRIAKNRVKQGVLRNTALLDGFLNNEIT